VSQAVPTATVRWAALLHDIGKVHTRSFTPNGNVHFFRHDEIGAYLGDGIMSRLNFPADMRRQIHTLILLHLRPGLYTADWSDAAVRRLINEAGDALELLFDLARADNTTKRMSKRLANLRNVKALSEHCKRVIAKASNDKAILPRGLGNAIKSHFKLQPGPRIGELCALCQQGMVDGLIAPDSSVEEHLDFLKNAPGVMNS
ncbi:MAG: HDIG domain-containing metalloprotein, partial [Bradymonadia bacterium]